ncbi:Sec-independent protein translocase protein TatB [Hephaestia sp. GCM10023244]|uniref:Sec-independent protein translocase protein TatB n=1 Tax=unclassified Hephaestia TaxID=2631281 RepID=UPI00207756D3|nr:Sec-independent protein translocase protein TatB [Hephaestia sp. MAHUQ-44]MCM8730696.1 Sec-independent protein translocase protein TatB [Hephaestia sp. MAHUQ-44]
MFDIAPTELLLVAFIAIIVIGPKDLPKAMRFVGHWVGRARGVARQFRSGFDAMVREAELEEMEKRWKEENERIMREHPSDDAPALPAPDDAAAAGDSAADDAVASGEAPATGSASSSEDGAPVMVEKPVLDPAYGDVPGTSDDDDNKARP